MLNISRRIKGLLFVLWGMPLYAVIQYLFTLLFNTFSGDSVFHGQISLIVSGLSMILIIYSASPLFCDSFIRPKISPVSVAAILLWGILFTLCYDLLAFALHRPFVISVDSVSDGSVLSLSAYFLLSAVIAPIIEEIFFRGYLWKVISDFGGGFYVKLIISSVVWAFLHGQYGLYDRAFLIVLGIILGILRNRSSGIYRCLLLHILINCTAFIQTLFFS